MDTGTACRSLGKRPGRQHARCSTRSSPTRSSSMRRRRMRSSPFAEDRGSARRSGGPASAAHPAMAGDVCGLAARTAACRAWRRLQTTEAGAASSDWARWSTTSATVHPLPPTATPAGPHPGPPGCPAACPARPGGHRRSPCLEDYALPAASPAGADHTWTALMPPGALPQVTLPAGDGWAGAVVPGVAALDWW